MTENKHFHLEDELKLEKRSPLSILFNFIAGYICDAWGWMIGLGIIHHHVKAVPAFGYWLTLLLWVLLGGCTAMRIPAINTLNTKRKTK